MQKILLNIGSIIFTIAPLTMVVNCGDNDKKEINIENKTPTQVLDIINEKMHVFMKEDAVQIIKDSTETKLNDYINGIRTNKAKFIFQGYNQTHTLDLTKIQPYLQQIKEVLKLSQKNRIDNGQAYAIGGKVVASTLISKQTSFLYGVSISGFMNLMKKSNTSSSITKNEINKHPYLNMLKEYHKQIWKFVKSDLYKKWIKDKTFDVFETKLNILVEKKVNPGEFMDKIDEFIKDGSFIVFPPSTIKDEFSNLEGQWLSSILNLKARITK